GGGLGIGDGIAGWALRRARRRGHAARQPGMVRSCRRHGRSEGPASSGGGRAAPARRRRVAWRLGPARARAGGRAPCPRSVGRVRANNRTPFLAHGNRQRRDADRDRRRQRVDSGRRVARLDRDQLRPCPAGAARPLPRPPRPGPPPRPAAAAPRPPAPPQPTPRPFPPPPPPPKWAGAPFFFFAGGPPPPPPPPIHLAPP